MTRLAALLVCTVLSWPAQAIDTETDLPDPALQARYEHLISELRCLVCQNQSIADSNAGLAADLRREVHAMLVAGRSDAEILAFMTDRYGDFVLYRPPFVARTWLLWLAPVLLGGIGLLVAVRIVKRRSQLLATDSDELDGEADRR